MNENIMNENIMNEQIILDSKKETISPIFTYSSKLLKEAIINTNTKIKDKDINIIDDYMAIFPLSLSILVFIIILILIYIYFFK